MKAYKLTMMLAVSDYTSEGEMKRLEHHIEELLDLDSWPEIHSVYGVKVENDESVTITSPHVKLLKEIIRAKTQGMSAEDAVKWCLSAGFTEKELIYDYGFDREEVLKGKYDRPEKKVW